VFESLTDAQWVGFSFVLLGMALIGGSHAGPWPVASTSSSGAPSKRHRGPVLDILIAAAIGTSSPSALGARAS
jgi:hypothetical protein